MLGTHRKFPEMLGANVGRSAVLGAAVNQKCRMLGAPPSDGRKRIGREMIRINTRWHNRVKNVRRGALLGAKQKKNGKRGKIIKEILIVYNLERNTKEMKMKK